MKTILLNSPVSNTGDAVGRLTPVRFNQHSFRFTAILLCLLALGIGNAWASHDTHTATLNVNKGTGSGTVYASTSSSATSGSASASFNCGGSEDGQHTGTLYAYATPASGYTFLGWTNSASSSAGADNSNPKGVAFDVTDGSSTQNLYAHFVEKAKVNITFVAPSNGTYTIKVNGGSAETVSSADVVKNNVEGVVLTAIPASGYAFAGWYKLNSAGEFVEDLSIANPYNASFTVSETIKMGARFVPTTLGKFILKGSSTEYYGLKAATVAAGGSGTIVPVAEETLVDGSDLMPFDNGTYTIKAGATLLVPYSSANEVQTKPKDIAYNSTGWTKALSIYKKLKLGEGVNINVLSGGVICIGGQLVSYNGGNPSAYPIGACGVIDMSSGGHIELNGTLYCWGFIKGQDMDQGNNTTAVGTITANNGAVIWEDFAVGDWRGGTACSTIAGNASSWKFFPFQSYTIQNVEVPTTYKYGSTLSNYTNVYGGGGKNEGTFSLIGNSNTLFLLKNASSFVRKWYDPTTDLVNYELSGTAQLDALNVDAGITTVSSSSYNLPISSNMQIVLTNCNMTISKPMIVQPGAVIEIKNDATLTLASNAYIFDVDNWGKYCNGRYFYSMDILTNHKNRGTGTSKELLDDATLIVDGTLNVTGKLYTTAGGADIMGNGGGSVKFSSLEGSGNIVMCTGVSTNENVAIAQANMHNEDDSYTQAEASTFYNVNGRWFAASAKDEKANHTYDFTYISSGAVSGTGGTSSTTDAVYSWDKTGLELQQKWANVTYSCEGKDENENTHYWWQGQGDQSTWFYNWTINSDWHQFMPTATEGMYSGSNNKIYTKTDCDWEELGETDENCLYTIGGVKKALVEGEFVALEPNNNDPAYHAAEDATQYYICFEGCNWHPATKYEGENKAYVVDEDIFIWYEGSWMNVLREDQFFYTLDETNVKIFYEYINGEWVVAMPFVQVLDAIEPRNLYSLRDAVVIASAKKNTTITLLRDFSETVIPFSYTASNTTCTLDLNGHVAEIQVVAVGDNKNNIPKMLTINGAGSTFTITDNTTEKKGELRLIASVSTATNTQRWSGIYVENGSLIMQNGTVHVDHTYTWKSNSDAGFISGILVASAKTFTMNGGTIHVEADYNPYGINAASGTPTVNINGGTIETVARTKDSPYAVFGYGTINVKGGTINAIAKASSTATGVYVYGSSSYQGTANISGGTILARSTSGARGAQCWGGAIVTADYSAETPDNTPKARYYAKLNITGGTIMAECTTSTSSYGVLSYGTTEISGGTITSTVQKSNQSTAYGVSALGGKTTIKSGANITATAPTKAYGVYCSGANGDSNRGWPHVGELHVEGGTITANTTNTTTAYGLLVTAATWTINKTNGYKVFNGDYAAAGTARVTGGTFYANAKTTLARGIAVAATQTKNAASATPKCTINGGYYKMTGTGDVLGCNASALPADFQINGGYYSHEGNLATYAVSPKQVVTLLQTDPNRPDYEYKVAEAYTVTFKNGETQLQSGYQEVGKSPVYEGDAPTKASTTTASYVFDGWSTTDGGALVSPLPALTSAGATYYAHYNETTLKYMVTFNAATNGGNEDAQVRYIDPSAAVGSLPEATKTGYTFNGWFTAASGGTKITASTVPAGDVTYFAQFTVNSHTLTWDLAGGKVSTAGKIGSTTWPAKNATGTQSKSVAYGTILTTIPVVTKTGYTFNRWNPVPTSSMPDEDVTYTALWNPNTNTKYTVKHYLQNVDDTYPTEPTETEALTGTTATSVTPEVKSYDGFVSPATQTVTIAAAGTTVVEYQYARRRYTFTLDAYTNGGTSEVPSIEVIHGATIGAVPPDAQKGCNDFTGWYTKPVGGVKITPEFVIEYDMKTLYAQFSDDVRTYPIIYNAGAHGTGSISNDVKTCGENATLSSNTFTRTGYTQTGWSLTDGGAQAYALGGTYTANASLTLYPVWAAVTYNLTYEGLNGATNSNPATYTIETATITLANPSTRAGYTFTGWTCGGNPITQIALGSTGNKTITANWSAVTYNLTYEGLNGATNSNPATYTIETATITLANPGTRAGYAFTGWTCGGSPITQIALGSTGVKTITANWSAVTYNLTYDGLNGATNSNPVTYTIETATITLANPGTRAGYAFTGWTCGGSPITQIALGSTGDKTITANWSAVTYNLTYEGLNGATNSNPVTYTIETATITLANPGTRAGYTFTGWTCGGSPITQIALGSTGDKVITANWEQIGVTILWKSEDGETILETDEGVVIGATPSFDGTDPTKATTESYTYTFDGWTTEANGGGTCYATDAMPPVSAAVTYYAHFAATANVASVTVGGATTYYTDFATAWNFVNDQTANTTIKLLQDVTSAASLVFTPAAAMTCTLDLNNHTLSGAVSKLIDINLAGSTFVITDSSEDKNGKVLAEYSVNARLYAVFLTAGTLNLKAGHIHSKNPHTYSSASGNKNSAATGVYVTAGQTFTMDGGTVESESQYASYAIYMARGTSTVTIQNGLVKGQTTKSTTAAGIYNLGKGLTVNDGRIVGHAYTTNAYGIHLNGGHGTINGGTIEATNDTTSSKGTTTTYGIYVTYYSSTYKGVLTIPSTSTVNVLAKARTTTSYAIVVGSSSTGSTIAGGTFTAKTKTGKTAYAVNSSGNITISGGTFIANSATTNAYGLYSARGTITVSGNPTFNVTSGTSTAYGALAYGTIGKKGTGKYSGTIKINGGTFNVTSTSTDAYGALAGLASRDLRSCSATNDTVPGLHYMPGILEITNGTFEVKAKTTTAYGVHVAAAKNESGDVGTTTKIPLGTITGGKFKVESMGDANATAYAMTTTTTAARLVVQGGYYSTKAISATANIEDKYTAPKKDCNYHVLPLTDEDPYKYEVAEAYMMTFKNGEDVLQSTAVKKGTMPVYSGEEPSKAADAQYTYAFTGWSPALATVTAAATYTATFTQTVNKYTITWVDGNGGTLKTEDLEYGAIPSYTGTTPTKTEDDDYTYTFNDTWSPAIVSVTGDATYTAQFTPVSKETGFYVDIVDVDNSTKTLKLNVSGTEWVTAGWPYEVNGTVYYRDQAKATAASSDKYRATDRTLTIPYTGEPGDNFTVTIRNTSSTLVSKHAYTIPQEIKSATTLVDDPTAPLFVKGATLTIDADITATNIYVGYDAKLVINSGKTLTADTVFFRTTPESAAELIYDGTISGKVCYTRIIKSKSGYFQFGLPLSCPISAVRLSNNNTVGYKTGSGWILRYYDENLRATSGPGDNWVTLDGAASIAAGRGYEMYSGVDYYREFYFPVDLSVLTNTVHVDYTAGAQPTNNGWNVLVSPLTHTYTQTPQPEMNISWMQLDGSFLQAPLTTVAPAMTFAYQAAKEGSIVFDGSSVTVPTLAPRRRVAAVEEPQRIQWMHLDITDANGAGDQTSVYSHPTRYAQTFQSGIDEEKQSLTASRALIYSSHAYGNMAFAGVADVLLENGVALTVYSPKEQELTISMRDNEWLDRMAFVWLIDNETGAQIDLLDSDYTFEAAAGTTTGRFILMGRFFAPQIATGIGNMQGSGQGTEAKKAMMDQKIYIIVGGRMYDATGKLVNK